MARRIALFHDEIHGYGNVQLMRHLPHQLVELGLGRPATLTIPARRGDVDDAWSRTRTGGKTCRRARNGRRFTAPVGAVHDRAAAECGATRVLRDGDERERGGPGGFDERVYQARSSTRGVTRSAASSRAAAAANSSS